MLIFTDYSDTVRYGVERETFNYNNVKRPIHIFSVCFTVDEAIFMHIISTEKTQNQMIK